MEAALTFIGRQDKPRGGVVEQQGISCYIRQRSGFLDPRTTTQGFYDYVILQFPQEDNRNQGCLTHQKW